jgi:parallel beta-helix repeat protein
MVVSRLAAGPSAVIAVLLIGTPAAAQAAEQAVACGTVVTRDLALTADLIDCPGDGLIVGASGITVDLGGHTISGSRGTGTGAADQIGIVNRDGFDDVVVRNGTVTQFYGDAVRMRNTDRSTVSALDVSWSEQSGIVIEGGARNRITGNDVRNTDDPGIVLSGSDTEAARNTIIDRNTAENNGAAGIMLLYGSIIATDIELNTVSYVVGQASGLTEGAVVLRGTARMSDTDIRRNDLTHNATGVQVTSVAQETLIENNRLLGNIGTGVWNRADATVIRFNTIARTEDLLFFPGDGVTVDVQAEGTQIYGNVMRQAGFIGVDDSGVGTSVTANVFDGRNDPYPTLILAGIHVREPARGARITGNTIITPQSFGIRVAGDDVHVTLNRATDSYFDDGILVEETASGAVLSGNAVSGHYDDGMDVRAPGTVVRATVANRNRVLGIRAVPGVVDGGANRARENGDPAQCVGVRCL